MPAPVPTRTGATAAGSVRGRAAEIHCCAVATCTDPTVPADPLRLPAGPRGVDHAVCPRNRPSSACRGRPHVNRAAAVRARLSASDRRPRRLPVGGGQRRRWSRARSARSGWAAPTAPRRPASGRLPARPGLPVGERLPVGGEPEHGDHPRPDRRDQGRSATRPRPAVCASVSSSARAVAYGTRLVMPTPGLDQLGSVRGDMPPLASIRSRVMPASCSAGQNRLPGRAKCAFDGGRPQPGVDPDEQQPDAGFDQVVDLGAVERLQLGPGEPGRPAHSSVLIMTRCPRHTDDTPRTTGRAP